MIPTASHTLADIDGTSLLLLIREKLIGGTYKEIAAKNKVDLDA
jgi:glycine C-acetyltransferase